MVDDEHRLALLVVAFNSSDLLTRNIADARLSDVATVVVVDNSTDPHEISRTRRICGEEEWEYIRPTSNIGFGAAVNAGAARAIDLGKQVLVLLNPDASMTKEGLTELASNASPNCIVAPLVANATGGMWFDGGEYVASRGVARHVSGKTDWLTGACLAIHVSSWLRLGGFDPDYFLYWEDVELCSRWRDLGGMLSIITSVTVVHEVGGTQGGSKLQRKSLAYVFYNQRNRLLFALRSARPREQLQILFWTPMYSVRLYRRARPQTARSRAHIVVALTRGLVSGLVIASRRQVRRKNGHPA